MQKRKYYYVIFGSGWDLYKQSYSDINELDDAVYISDEVIRSNFLRRLHLGKINKYVNLPFKGIWNHAYFENPFPKDRKICYIFFRNWLELNKEVGFVDYLKKKTPDAKFVFFLQDLYKNFPYPKDKFDLVLSYDKKDCEKYGFTYHHTIFSQNITISLKTTAYCDVLFVGKAKTRLPRILSYYQTLIQAGLKCEFFLFDVPKDKCVEGKGIHYLSKMLSYSEVLGHVKNANCLLEVMQEDAIGYTYRLWEAITFDKKLLTDNVSLLEDVDFYSPKYISVIRNGVISSGNIQFVRNDVVFENPYKNELKPERLLDFIDGRL